ncbi:2-oxo-4-hydroxy-4-carboxy-5-ureidoimidazoline decarboxylase [Synechocystis sp. PCC 7509]|uniref:2-oxo-4-hydroxy-4-carboxy-5-ureidoimidazoline decarboxylase n=1 Tax=Synechocystis sp. PCC 7509 TaxID=927677 RepID=UPI0002AC7253|nr:2-oxo-4-hydroxy-4-carboxy-5-ureidoimidazoline decarboxylase [Synechocystis sp. PCC 7509]
MSKSITDLNQMSQEEFVSVLGTLFEHTPEIAQKAWSDRPFADIAALYQKMVDIVSLMTIDEQLALIRAHPDLGSKALMAEASVVEQSGLGLDRLTPQEYDYFQLLNQTYKDKFGFPFIVAVKNQTKDSILNEFERRLKNTIEAEIASAIAQINKIAWFRLLNLVEN